MEEIVVILKTFGIAILIGAILDGIALLNEWAGIGKKDVSDSDKCTARFTRTRRFYFKD